MPDITEAVIIVEGDSSCMYPLTPPDEPITLLPIANQAILSYILRNLEEIGFQQALVVVTGGEGPANHVKAWIRQSYVGPLKAGIQVLTASYDAGTAEALRVCLPYIQKVASDGRAALKPIALTAISADSIQSRIYAGQGDVLVMNGAVLLEFQAIITLMCSHRANNCLFSALLVSRNDETKKDGDFIALDRKHQKKIVMMRSGFSGSDSTSRDIKIPLNYLARLGSAVIRTDLVESETYIFSRQALQSLDPTPRRDDGQDTTHAVPSTVKRSLREDFIPRLLEKQFSSNPNSIPEIPMGESSTESSKVELQALGGCLADDISFLDSQKFLSSDDRNTYDRRLPAFGGRRKDFCLGEIVENAMCMKIRSLQAYAEANRDIISDSNLLAHAIGLKSNGKPQSAVPESVEMGQKVTLSAGTLLGEHVKIGNKCSVKKSVIGDQCVIGSSVKLVNCIIMNDAVIEDGCILQSCVVGSRAHLLDKCSLKECYIESDYVSVQGAEHKSETLTTIRKVDQKK